MSGILETLFSLDRKVVIAGVLVILVLVAAGYFLTRDGEGGDGDDLVIDLEAAEAAGPVVDQASVDEAVAAALEAMIPTEVPTPTPDIAATLQAELDANREEVDRVLTLNPLDVESGRNPYLTPSELELMERLGERLWTYTRVWLYIQEVLYIPTSDWTLEGIESEVRRSQLLVENAPRRVRLRDLGEINDVVLEYVETIEFGIQGVEDSVRRLDDAVTLLREAESTGGWHQLDLDDRSQLMHISRDVENSLQEFDEAMSSYGCSVCGELFRRDG